MRVVLCNCAPDQASELAHTLVSEGLCACVNVLPGVRSVYEWAGEICDEVESTLIIKVADHGVSALRDRIVHLHRYDVPEVVVLDVDEARSHAPYVDWVRQQTRRQE